MAEKRSNVSSSTLGTNIPDSNAFGKDTLGSNAFGSNTWGTNTLQQGGTRCRLATLLLSQPLEQPSENSWGA